MDIPNNIFDDYDYDYDKDNFKNVLLLIDKNYSQLEYYKKYDELDKKSTYIMIQTKTEIQSELEKKVNLTKIKTDVFYYNGMYFSFYDSDLMTKQSQMRLMKLNNNDLINYGLINNLYKIIKFSIYSIIQLKNIINNNQLEYFYLYDNNKLFTTYDVIIYKQYKKLEENKLYLLNNIFPENIDENDKTNYIICFNLHIQFLECSNRYWNYYSQCIC